MLMERAIWTGPKESNGGDLSPLLEFFFGSFEEQVNKITEEKQDLFIASEQKEEETNH